MDKFFIKEFSGDIKRELLDIGFDKSYINIAKNKFNYKNLKIFDLSPAQANIIKQTALSVGADCATHRDVISGNIKKSNCILGGSFSQIKKIAEKLKAQPFSLKTLAEQLETNIVNNFSMDIKNTHFDFSRTYIVGILNLGKSFSDGYSSIDDAKAQLIKLVEDGADVIDIGAESTKPGSLPVCDEEQLSKILPILKFISSENINVPISIDTRSSVVAKSCLDNGADIINDVSGLDYDNNMIDVISKYNCPIIIQHSSATPDIMQSKTNYNNLIDDIYKILSNKIDCLIKKNISSNNIIIDPGIGFGKTKEQNLEILNRINEFYSLNMPVMVGISRKSFIDINCDNSLKDVYTLALNTLLINKGIHFIRVHNVALHKILLDAKIL